MKILSNRKINYCNLTRETNKGVEYLLGIDYDNKLHIKNIFFSREREREALEYCRQKFLDDGGRVSYLLVKDLTGSTIWIEDSNVKIVDKYQSQDAIERIDLEDLSAKMHNIGGVLIKDRRYRLRIYSKCFVGSEAVTWMKSTFNLSTEQAIKLGQKLIDEKIIHHVLDKQDFANEYLFYRFYWDEV